MTATPTEHGKQYIVYDITKCYDKKEPADPFFELDRWLNHFQKYMDVYPDHIIIPEKMWDILRKRLPDNGANVSLEEMMKEDNMLNAYAGARMSISPLGDDETVGGMQSLLYVGAEKDRIPEKVEILIDEGEEEDDES